MGSGPQLVLIEFYLLTHACMCAQSLSCVQLFATPWTAVHQAHLSLGFSRQECWNGLPCPPPGDLPDPGIELSSVMSPALAGGQILTKEKLDNIYVSKAALSKILKKIYRSCTLEID